LPYGIFGMNPEPMVSELKDGCTFLLCGVDTSTLLNSYADMIKVLKMV